MGFRCKREPTLSAEMSPFSSWGKGLGAICLAICQDCFKCAANKAKIVEREVLDRAKLLQEDEPRDGRITTPWKNRDSKVDTKLPYLDCYV